MNLTWLIVWAVVFVFALGIELATTQLVSVWFSGGALVAIILAACNVNYVVQVIVWVCVSAGLLIVFKLFLEKRIKDRSPKTNYDAIIGDEILITEDVSPTKNGAGKYRDVVWTVVSKDELSAGQFAVVSEIKGNKLVAKKKEK